ncbi:MAG: hypothetical protein Q9181_004614 [Wetmoreana brouardii]
MKIGNAYMQGQNDPEYETIIKAISAITFLATPHRGTNLAELLDRILRSGVFTNSKHYISELGKSSFTLQKLNEQFRHIAPRLDIVSFYETQSTSIGLKNSRVMILEKDSSVLGYPGETSKALNADHHNVCKFDNPQDPNYISVRNALQSLISKIVSKTSSQDSSSLIRKNSANVRSLLAITELPDTDYIFFRDQWSQGTCDWLLEDKTYLEWLHCPDSTSSLFWLHGGAAAGKSVLSSFIINNLIQKGFCCQYYYFRFGDQRKRTLSLFLRSIAYQLILSKPEFLQRVLQLKEEAIDFGTADPRTIWERIFKPILFRMPDSKPIYWIIDGLDEADDPRAFIKILSEISASSAPIRVLIVSRKTSEILSDLQKIPDELQLKSLSVDGHEEDFSHYIRQELNMFGDADFKESIVKQIVSGAQNNFLWVRLSVENLNHCHTKEDIELALHQLPIGMQALYDRMASSIARNPSIMEKQVASTILQYTTTSLRVLTSAELSQALHDGTSGLLNFQRSIVDLCGGFIIIDNGGYVAMIHQTAREYLLSGSDRPFHVEKAAAHKQVFLSSMRCLMTIGLRAKIDGSQKPVFLDYAVCSWPVHLASTSVKDAEVAKALHKFLAGRWVLTWIQVLATFEQLHVLVQASRHLARYSAKQKLFGGTIKDKQSLAKQELVKSWAEDFAKVVGKFGGILRRNPESIHKLIPPFCPKNSAIYQQFGKMRDKSLVVSGFSSSNWDDSLARLSFGLGTYATSVSAAGAQIATLIPSGSVLLHGSSTFEECSPSPIKHGERLYRMELNSPGTLLATYGYRTTKLWETRTGKCRLSVENIQSRPRPLAMLLLENDQRLLVGSDDRLIRSLNLDSNTPSWQVLAALEEPELEGHFLNSPNHMALDRGGKLISVAYRGHPLSAWEIDGPVQIGHCWRTREEVARGEVIEAVWHPHHPEILGLYIEGVIFRWRPYDDEAEEFAAGASRLAMSKDGNLLVTGDVREMVKVYCTADFCVLYQLTSEDNVLGLTFSPDLRRFYDVRGNYGNAWEPNALLKFVEQQNKDTESGGKVESFTQISTESEHFSGRVDAITALAASPVDRLYCYGDEKGAAYLYDTERGKLADINTSKGFLSIEQMSWSNDGHLIGFSDSSKQLIVKKVDPKASNPDSIIVTLANISVKTTLDGPTTQLLFHPDSSQLLVCSSSSICTISLVRPSIDHSSQVGTVGSRWLVHPQDPALIIGIGTHDIHVLDWNLSLHKSLGIERSLDQTMPSSLPHHEMVEKVLVTHDKKHILKKVLVLDQKVPQKR